MRHNHAGKSRGIETCSHKIAILLMKPLKKEVVLAIQAMVCVPELCDSGNLRPGKMAQSMKEGPVDDNTRKQRAGEEQQDGSSSAKTLEDVATW